MLSWEKPKKTMTTEEWNSISADGAPPGVYTPNMSKEDREKWKAKKIGGKDPRVELRKMTGGKVGKTSICANVLLVVRPNGSVVWSANGKSIFDIGDIIMALKEAKDALEVS